MARRLTNWLDRRALALPVVISPSGGWHGVEDVPEPLQFAAYIGQREGFGFKDEATPQSESEREWRRWWLDLPAQHASWAARLRSSVEHGGSQSAPPGFVPPADRPQLRALYDRYRASFQQDWTGIKLALIHIQLGPNTRRIDLNRIIRARERELGRRTRPFTYRIDYVFWPNDYMRAVSDNHLVLSIDVLDEAHREEYHDLMRKLIGRLV